MATRFLISTLRNTARAALSIFLPGHTESLLHLEAGGTRSGLRLLVPECTHSADWDRHHLRVEVAGEAPVCLWTRDSELWFSRQGFAAGEPMPQDGRISSCTNYMILTVSVENGGVWVIGSLHIQGAAVLSPAQM